MNDVLIESAPAASVPWSAVAAQSLFGAAVHPRLTHELQATLWQVLTETLARARSNAGQGATPGAPPTSPVLASFERRPAALAALAATPANMRLSTREHEVLLRIAAGDSNKLIARAFDLSPHTVKRHVANILDKLGASSRGQAAAWWRAQR